MPDLLTYMTTCKVIVNGVECGQQFRANPLDVPIIGEPPNAKTLRFVEALGKHIQKKHPEAGTFIAALGMQVQGYLITSSFRTEDPGLLKIQNDLRHHVHQFTRRNFITDDAIVDTVARLGFTAETGAPIVAAFRDMRDMLTETGKYAPAQQGQTVAA